MHDNQKNRPFTRIRLMGLRIGNSLLIFFLLSIVVATAFLVNGIVRYGFISSFKKYFVFILVMIIVEVVVFWIGIALVYITSVQIGLKLRIIGIVVGMVPIANLITLIVILRKTIKELTFERNKLKLDEERKDKKICCTKYPILMVHGVFFRDYKYLNYWGRIPAELEQNGATVYYGMHESASAVRDSAKQLAERIEQIVQETGCKKVNVIAHSKGGLDAKCAVVTTDVSKYIASITTINTPHRGCEFADYLLAKTSDGIKNKVANAYNAALRKAGDKTPDFISAVTDLTAENCKSLTELTDGYDYKGAGIYTQSVGSCMKKSTSGAFPLNMSYHLVGHFDGPNDGLVGESSFKWGEDYTFLENSKERGISHGDVIDLNRENIVGFDIREFYVQLVAGLKKRGL